MSQYHNVVLVGGPADGRRVSVLHGVSTVRVCEMPGIDYSHLSDRRPDLTRDALRTFEYEICWGAGNWKVACLRGNDSQGVLDALIHGYRAEVQR